MKAKLRVKKEKSDFLFSFKVKKQPLIFYLTRSKTRFHSTYGIQARAGYLNNIAWYFPGFSITR